MRVSAVHLPRVNDDQMLVGNVVFLAFNLDICLAVQLIEQFDLLVPVQRMVTSRCSVVSQLYAKFIDLVKCFVIRVP